LFGCDGCRGYLVGCGLLIWFAAGRLGTEIFPTFDAGEFRLRLRAPDGTHIDKTEQIALQTLDVVKQEVGAENVALTLGYVGTIPASFPINAVYQFSRGPEEAILRIALKHGSGISTESMKEVLRTKLRERLPEVRYSFEPADIVSEVMSFGSPTPIEVAVRGGTIPENRAFLKKVEQSLGSVPALRDVQVVQSLDYPTIDVKIDREKAGMTGTTVSQVTRSVLAATSSSRFVVPNYWPDPKTGIGYQVQVEIPQPTMDSVDDLATVPVRQASDPVLLRDVAEISSGTMPGEFDRYNMKRELTLTANIAGADLGSVSGDVVRRLNQVQQQDNTEKDALEKEALAKGQPKPGRVTSSFADRFLRCGRC
jgi:multidrug efflux pump subunit AcrB